MLGTDQLGRDQLLRLIYGGRVSLTIAYLASVLTVFIGITLGLLAGYYGRRVDDLISWGINTLSAIPPLFLLLIAAAVWEPSTEVLIVVSGGFGLGRHQPGWCAVKCFRLRSAIMCWRRGLWARQIIRISHLSTSCPTSFPSSWLL